jgi:hypothetical protein
VGHGASDDRHQVGRRLGARSVSGATLPSIAAAITSVAVLAA